MQYSLLFPDGTDPSVDPELHQIAMSNHRYYILRTENILDNYGPTWCMVPAVASILIMTRHEKIGLMCTENLITFLDFKLNSM